MRETFDREEQLCDLVGIEERGERIRAIARRYNSAVKISEELNDQIEHIKTEKYDGTLKMSVVGEFSAGKSSFINALMREEALESGAAQGTTRLPVVIRYGELNTLYIQDENGRVLTDDLTKNGEPRQEIIRRLNSQSTEGEKRRILLYSNSDFFKKGICVVDTPGTNSIEEWHEEAVKRSVSELADGCIILTPATHPMSESLCSFIQNSLPFSIQNCVFLLSKIDMLDPKEREKQLEYVKTRIKSRFGIESPFVLPYSAKHIAEGGSEKESSLKTEEKIREFLLNNRMLVQKTAQLSKLSRIGNDLLGELERIRSTMKVPHTSSEKFSQASLSEFTKKELSYCSCKFDAKVFKEKEALFAELKKCQNNEEASLEKIVGSFGEPSQLRNVFCSIQNILSDIHKKMNDIYVVFFKKIEKTAADISADFNKRFSEAFESDVSSAEINFSNSRCPTDEGKINHGITELILSDINKTEKKIKHSAPFRIFLGAGIGAEIIFAMAFVFTAFGERLDNGAILLPFTIITIWGAIIGAISFGITHRRKKAKRVAMLKERISRLFYIVKAEYFRSLYIDYTDALNQHIPNVRNSLMLYINNYIEEYLREISNINSAKAKQAQNAVFSIESDIKALQNEIKDVERLISMFGSVRKGES